MICRISTYKRYEYVFRYDDTDNIEQIIKKSINDMIQQLKQNENLQITSRDISKIIIKQHKTEHASGYIVIIIVDINA